MPEISPNQLQELRDALTPLRGVQLNLLSIPRDVLAGFEPSQIGTLVGSLVDPCIPLLNLILPKNSTLATVGLTKHAGILGDREGYPDYDHVTGRRLELKLLYVDPIDVLMKKPPTRREPSARLTEKVTVKNVDAARDALLVIAYQLQPNAENGDLFSPTIVDFELFSMIECIRARDHRLLLKGRWMGDFETPVILSGQGKAKVARGEEPSLSTYGQKANEGHDYNKDTNFGKLKRIPYAPLQLFLKKHNASYTRAGTYPQPWYIPSGPGEAVPTADELRRLEAEED